MIERRDVLIDGEWLPSAGGGRIRSAAVTAGTSMRRSIRSIKGPEMRTW